MIRCVSTENRNAKNRVAMDNKEPGILEQIEGLTSVEADSLKEFNREMSERVVPKIRQIVERRRMLAAESRQRKLERQVGDKTKAK
jgi:hypothetical protein